MAPTDLATHPSTTIASPTMTADDTTPGDTPGADASHVDKEVDEDAIFADFDAEPGTQDFNPQDVTEEVLDDESAEVRRRVQLGQAIMHVGPVDPDWKISFNNVQNRPVNEQHVAELAKNFVRIRRCQPQDQLDLAMTPEHFEHCLTYTVEQMQAKGGKCARPCYRDVDALRAAVDPNVFYMKFEEMPVLCWDVRLGVMPSLKTGQHRRRALLRRHKIPLPYRPDQEIDEENKAKCGWGMCIVDATALDVKYFTAICLNKRDVYEAANNGDNFITAYKAYISLAPEKRSAILAQNGAFVAWLKTELAIPDSQEKRVRQIFARPLWRYLCKAWNETQWGREIFTLYNFCLAASQRLDHVWKPAIEAIFTALEDLVGDKEMARMLTKHDMELIQLCGHPDPLQRHDPTGKRDTLYKKSVKQAFFPKPKADVVGKIDVNPEWFATPEEKQRYTIRANERLFAVDEELLRRPGFMTCLNDIQYQQVADKVYKRHHALPNPLSLNTELQSIGPRVQALCNFTIWIANPAWTEPGNAATDAARWTYAEVIADFHQPLPAVQDPTAEAEPGAVSEDEYLQRKEENKRKGEFYTDQLRKHLISNLKDYNKIPEKTFADIKSGAFFPASFSTRTSRQDFRARFGQPALQLFLRFVVKHWTTKRFAGVMRAFALNPRLLDDLGSTLPPLFRDIKSKFSAAAKKRYPRLQPMAENPSVEEEYARNAEYLRLRIEYEELRRLCRNWNSRVKRQTAGDPTATADERPPAYEDPRMMAIESKEEYQTAFVALKHVSHGLRKYGVDVTIETEEDINKGTQWPTTLLRTDLDLVDEGEADYESDYTAPPPSATGKGRKRQRSTKAALSSEYVDTADDDNVFDAEPIPSSSRRAAKKSKQQDDRPVAIVADDNVDADEDVHAKANPGADVDVDAAANSDAADETPTKAKKARKSTGGRGGPAPRKAPPQPRTSGRAAPAATRRKKSSNVARKQQKDVEEGGEDEE